MTSSSSNSLLLPLFEWKELNLVKALSPLILFSWLFFSGLLSRHKFNFHKLWQPGSFVWYPPIIMIVELLAVLACLQIPPKSSLKFGVVVIRNHRKWRRLITQISSSMFVLTSYPPIMTMQLLLDTKFIEWFLRGHGPCPKVGTISNLRIPFFSKSNTEKALRILRFPSICPLSDSPPKTKIPLFSLKLILKLFSSPNVDIIWWWALASFVSVLTILLTKFELQKLKVAI